MARPFAGCPDNPIPALNSHWFNIAAARDDGRKVIIKITEVVPLPSGDHDVSYINIETNRKGTTSYKSGFRRPSRFSPISSDPSLAAIYEPTPVAVDDKDGLGVVNSAESAIDAPEVLTSDATFERPLTIRVGASGFEVAPTSAPSTLAEACQNFSNGTPGDVVRAAWGKAPATIDPAAQALEKAPRDSTAEEFAAVAPVEAVTTKTSEATPPIVAGYMTWIPEAVSTALRLWNENNETLDRIATSLEVLVEVLAKRPAKDTD